MSVVLTLTIADLRRQSFTPQQDSPPGNHKPIHNPRQQPNNPNGTPPSNHNPSITPAKAPNAVAVH